MARITLDGKPINTCGALPAVGAAAPDFVLAGADFADVRLDDLKGKRVVLNIFLSVDTSVCAASVKRFNETAAAMDDVVVLCISADLPFALDRFCGAEGIDRVKTASTFRSPEFGRDYGVTIADGAVAGLLSRAVVVLDRAGKAMYTEQVPEIAQEPDYDAALAALDADRNVDV